MYTLPQRLLSRDGRRPHPALLRLLKRFYGSVPADLTLAELREMTQHWVLSKQNDPLTGTPAAERFAALPDVRWSDMKLEDCLEDFAELGFVNAMHDLQGITNFIAAIVPGGTVLPQWRRLTNLIMLYMTAGVRFRELIFGARRPYDARVDQLSKLWTPDGKTPAGCLPLKPDAVIPTEIPEEAKGNMDHFWMRLLWNNLTMPDELRSMAPLYVEFPEQHVAGWSGNFLIASLVPHLFHQVMFQRATRADARVVMVSPWALDGRHDLSYLADGLARYIDQYYQWVLSQLRIS